MHFYEELSLKGAFNWVSVWVAYLRFNPTSIRITDGVTASQLATFQSYFIQDYRWKWQDSVGTIAIFLVSILLHSGLPLEDRLRDAGNG